MTLSRQSCVAPIGAILARHVLPTLQRAQKMPLRISCIGTASYVLDLATGETIAWTYTDGWLAQVLDGGDPDA